MDSSGDPMDWDYTGPKSPSTTDWEPEIPGQFHTPIRLRRKRNAEAAGFATDNSAVLKTPAFYDSEQPIHDQDAPVMFIAAVLMSTFWLIGSFITLPILGYRLTRRGAAAATRQVVEIRQYTAEGYQSIKRRATDITRPVTNTAQRILRRDHAIQRPSAIETTQRQLQPYPITTPAIDHFTDEANTPNIQRAEPHISEIQTADLDTVSSHHIEVPQMSREPNELRPQGPEKPEQPKAQVVRDNRGETRTAVHDNRPEYIRRMEQPNPVIDPIVEAKALAAIRRSLIPKSLPHDKKNQQTDQHQNRHIAPDLKHGKVKPVNEHVTSPLVPTDNEQVQNIAVKAQQQSTRTNDEDEYIPTERRVRIALDPHNGQVQESFGKFFKNSLVGEWAPSSPWTIKQIKRNQMDLKEQLNLLMDYPTSVGTTEDLPSVVVPSNPSEIPPAGFENGTTAQKLVESDLPTTTGVSRTTNGTSTGAEGHEPEIEDIFSELALSTEVQEKRAIRKQLQQTIAAQRAADREAEAKAKAEAEEAARKGKHQRRTPGRKLIQPLSMDWEARIEEAMLKGDHVPLTTTANGTELRRKDFLTVLGEREWLNDEIINAYLEWITEFANEKAGKNGRTTVPKIIAHNSFFYKKIDSDGPQSVARWMKRKRAEGKKLLEVERVLIPVNNAAHWTLIVVSPIERTIEYLDSFSGPPTVFINNVMKWLDAELGPEFRREEWKVLETNSAVQKNGYDCGVFAVTNAECVSGSLDTMSYSASDMTAQRRRIAAVLLNRGFGGELVAGEEL